MAGGKRYGRTGGFCADTMCAANCCCIALASDAGSTLPRLRTTGVDVAVVGGKFVAAACVVVVVVTGVAPGCSCRGAENCRAPDAAGPRRAFLRMDADVDMMVAAGIVAVIIGIVVGSPPSEGRSPAE